MIRNGASRGFIFKPPGSWVKLRWRLGVPLPHTSLHVCLFQFQGGARLDRRRKRCFRGVPCLAGLCRRLSPPCCGGGGELVRRRESSRMENKRIRVTVIECLLEAWLWPGVSRPSYKGEAEKVTHPGSRGREMAEEAVTQASRRERGLCAPGFLRLCQGTVVARGPRCSVVCILDSLAVLFQLPRAGRWPGTGAAARDSLTVSFQNTS